MLVEKGAFRRLVLYLAKHLKESDIPSRSTVRREILHKAEEAVDIVKVLLKVRRLFETHRESPTLIRFIQNAPGRSSFTLDIWTKRRGEPFLSLTVHYISVDPKNPLLWKLETDQIGFEHAPGSHTGKNIAKLIVKVLRKYEIPLAKVQLLHNLS